MANDPHSILWRGTDPVNVAFQPKRRDRKEKPGRYWAGKAPEWGEEEQEVAEDFVPSRVAGVEQVQGRLARLRDHVALQARADAAAAAAGFKRVRERLRPEEAEVLDEEEGAPAQAPAPEDGLRPDVDGGFVAEQVQAAGLLSDEDEDEDEDEEAVNLRRQMARQKAQHRRQAEEEALLAKQDVLADEDDEDSEQDSTGASESEDEDPFGRVMLKPMFVPKNMRATEEEKRQLQEEEQRQQDGMRKANKVKKDESRALVKDIVEKEEQGQEEKNAVSDAEMPGDEDDNEAEEYELWKIRELKRIKRTAERRKAREKELAEVERRRRMTEAERAADDQRLDAANPKVEKQKFTFLQKYYHKGGFFQDKARPDAGDKLEPLYRRDFNEPVAEDTLKRDTLPKVMQVRRGYWGKKGQVKHTHLTAVDTTDKNAAWVMDQKRVDRKRAGVKAGYSFERPSER